jgi:glycosyltransferase involved in cell wall biosynthesis
VEGLDRAVGPGNGDSSRISVIINTARREKYVDDALRSVERQSLGRDRIEVVVVSGRQDVLSHLAGSDASLILLRDSDNAGGYYASGIRESTGEIIALLDDDDEFLPSKLLVISNLFRTHPHLELYHHHREYMDEERKPLPDGFLFPRASRKLQRGSPILLAAPYDKRSLLRLTSTDVLFNSSSLVVRRRFVQPLLPLLSRVELAVDSFLVMAAIAERRSVLVDGQRLSRYRIHTSNASQVASHSALSPPSPELGLKYEARIEADGELIRRFLTKAPDDDFARVADALVAVNGFYRSVRYSTRREQMRWALKVLSRVDTFIGRSHVLPALTVFASLPFPKGVQPWLDSARRLLRG